MYVLIERNNVHLRGSNIKRNLLSMKEADLGPNIREILLDKFSGRSFCLGLSKFNTQRGRPFQPFFIFIGNKIHCEGDTSVFFLSVDTPLHFGGERSRYTSAYAWRGRTLTFRGFGMLRWKGEDSTTKTEWFVCVVVFTSYLCLNHEMDTFDFCVWIMGVRVFYIYSLYECFSWVSIGVWNICLSQCFVDRSGIYIYILFLLFFLTPECIVCLHLMISGTYFLYQRFSWYRPNIWLETEGCMCFKHSFNVYWWYLLLP